LRQVAESNISRCSPSVIGTCHFQFIAGHELLYKWLFQGLVVEVIVILLTQSTQVASIAKYINVDVGAQQVSMMSNTNQIELSTPFVGTA